MYASYLMHKHDYDFNQRDMEDFRKWIAAASRSPRINYPGPAHFV